MSILRINPISINPYSYNTNKNVSHPNFRGGADADNDVVEISRDKKKNKALKVFLIGWGIKIIVGFAGIKLYKKHYINKAQETFKEVFMRDSISKEETIEMLKRYKNIKKIKDKDEYIKALFEETKKNYGFQDGNLELKFFDSKERPNTGGFVQKFKNQININKDRKPLEILNTMNHEMKHKQQEYFMMNYCGDAKTCVENFTANVHKGKLSNSFIKELLAENPNWLKQFNLKKLDKNNVPEKYREYTEHLLKDLKIYEESKIIDGKINKEYYDNFLEVDARNAGDKMRKLLSWFIPV